MDQELLKAYTDAIYRIENTTDFKIGEYNEELAKLHASRQASNSYFITAFNPASKRLPAEENAARHAELGEKLNELSVEKIPAAGLDPDGEWPPEPGYLVFDIDLSNVIDLGQAYGQNAVVRIGPDTIPRLIMLAVPKE